MQEVITTTETKASNEKVYHELSTEEDQEEKEIGCCKSFFRSTCTYGSLILLSFMYGFNHTSFNNIKNISLNVESKDFYPELHELFSHLPPTFFFTGGLIATIFLYNMKSYRFGLTLKISSGLLLVSYIVNVLWPHITVVYGVRLVTGIASGLMALCIPQILHKIAGENNKAFMSSIFPLFLLIGLTSAVALIPLCTPELYVYINCIPCLISGLALLMLFNTEKFETSKKNDSSVNLRDFLSSSATIKSVIFIIFIHLIQKTTGVDFIGLFSSEIFPGENQYIYSLIPLLMAILFTAVSGFLPDKLGRKIPVAFGLFGISIVCFVLYAIGSNIYTVPFFIIFYNCGLNVVPYMYQNEVVPPSHKAIANELGCFSSWLLSILMAIFIAFIYRKGSSFIWLPFGVMSVVAFLRVVLIMKETKGLKEYTFIESWLNICSWYTAKTGHSDSIPA